MAETPSEFYARTSTLPTPEKTKRFLKHLPSNGAMLDFGCGSGRWAAAFQRDRPDLTIDVLDRELDLAPLIGGDWKGTRYHQSFESFRSEKHYDGIWSFASLFFLPPNVLAEVVARLRDALKPNGIFFFTMVDPGARTKFYGMSPFEIKTLLNHTGFNCKDIKDRLDQYGVQKQEIRTYYVTAHRI